MPRSPALLIAAAASLLAPAAASAVPVTVSVPTAAFVEGQAGYASINFRAATSTSGTIEIYASSDGVSDGTDPLVGTATLGATSGFFATARISLDDRVINPGGTKTWTLFFKPTAGLELDRAQANVITNDDDLSGQPALSQLLTLKGRSLSVPIEIADQQTSFTATATQSGKTISTVKLQPATGRSTLTFVIAKKRAATLKAKGGTITVTLKGSSALRDITTSTVFKLRGKRK